MMILLVNQCRLLAPAATLPSSFIIIFSLGSDTQKFYTSAAFHLHSQCHLFSITHSLSLFFFFLKALANRATTPFAAWEWHKQNREIIFLLTISSLFPGLLFYVGWALFLKGSHWSLSYRFQLLKGKKIILNTYIFDKGRTLTFKHFSHRIPSSKWVFLGVLVRNDKTFVSLIVFVMFLRVLLPSKWKVSCQRKSVKPVLVFLTCCKYCV